MTVYIIISYNNFIAVGESGVERQHVKHCNGCSFNEGMSIEQLS